MQHKTTWHICPRVFAGFNALITWFCAWLRLSIVLCEKRRYQFGSYFAGLMEISTRDLTFDSSGPQSCHVETALR